MTVAKKIVVRAGRHEAIRLAKRIGALGIELVGNRKAVDAAVGDVAPELREPLDVGSVIAADVPTNCSTWLPILRCYSRHGIGSAATAPAQAESSPLPFPNTRTSSPDRPRVR